MMMIVSVMALLVCFTADEVNGFSLRPSKGRSISSLAMATASPSSSGKTASMTSVLTVDDPRLIRNVALVGHTHTGKTRIAEWMLFDEHVVSRKPGTGAPLLDNTDPTEIARHSTVFSHFCRIAHGPHLLTAVDTPWGDFPSDALSSLDGADGAIVVVSAADSVQSGTISAFQHCRQAGIKTLIALSKMDRPFVNVLSVLDDIQEAFEIQPIPLQVPVGQEEKFDLIPLLVLDEGGQIQKNDAAGIEDAWTTLEEAVAMTDDDLLVEYLEESKLHTSQVIEGLRRGVIQDKILPLVYTAAEQDKGIRELMDAIVGVLPNPVDMREEAVRVACEAEAAKCNLRPGVEAGFAARVLHTSVDSFGTLSVLRIISNSCNDDSDFDSLPSEVVNLRTGETLKMPSVSTAFGLCGGKERISLQEGSPILPGDVVAVPKLSAQTNDILTVREAVKTEKDEITFEIDAEVLTPLSRGIKNIPLMKLATISLKEAGNHGKSSKHKTADNDDKLISALRNMAREDLSMRVEQDPSSDKLLLRCMSSDHMHLLGLRLKERYGFDVEFGQPPLQYRETLVKAVKNIEGRHKKQSGGSGQFGVCYINMEPLDEGAGIEFESQIKGGAISKPFITSVEKGVRDQLLAGGPLGGFPVTDVRVTLIDGKMHSVDSKDVAFQSAGKQAVKAALEKGKTRILQPMEIVTFVLDEKLQGEISAIVARHEGYVTGSSTGQGAEFEMQAILPAAALGEVSDALLANSGGEARLSSVFSHYSPVPDALLSQILSSDTTRDEKP